MFSTLRNRLILSHILPVLIIIPLAGVALFFLLETRFLLPSLARDLTADARYLANISRSDFELFGNPLFARNLLSRVRLDPAIQVMLLSPRGELLYSTDPADTDRLGSAVSVEGLDDALAGEESIQTNYSITRLNDVLIDVLEPVLNSSGQVIGLVRVSYRSAVLFGVLSQLRNLIAWVLILGLVLGALLGLFLAINLSRPIQQVTRAIDGLAAGDYAGEVVVQGPQELRDLARSVNYLVERLHSLELARRQLLANLVHELGRPLGALRSAIQALDKGAGKDPELLADLARGMDGEAEHMGHILEDLARLHDQVLGTLELHRQDLSIGDWLPGVLLPWRQAAEEKRLRWQQDIPPALPTVSADPVRLTQVIGNLASNAVRYSPSGGSVTVAAGEQDGMLWISVSDTGPGIAADEQARVFEPFYRGDQGQRIKQGMGLGLSIANDLARAHGGRIQLESAPGAGSRFTLWLPALESQENP